VKSGLRRWYAFFSQGHERSLVELHGDEHGYALAAAGQHGRVVAVASLVDRVGERVAHVGDAFLVLNLRRGHSRSVSDHLHVRDVHERYDGHMLEDLPEGLAASMSSTLQHIRLIQEKEARLAAVREESLTQLIHQIGTEYRTGGLEHAQFQAAFERIHRLDVPGRMKAWSEIVGVPWQRMIQLGKQLPNGPEGSWVGEYPISAAAPRPIYGVSVVYVLFDDANEPCYVGSTDKLSARMNAHAKDGKRFVRWQAHPCRGREHAYRLEDQLLKQYLPPLNKKASR
jgi:hypothetical protein